MLICKSTNRKKMLKRYLRLKSKDPAKETHLQIQMIDYHVHSKYNAILCSSCLRLYFDGCLLFSLLPTDIPNCFTYCRSYSFAYRSTSFYSDYERKCFLYVADESERNRKEEVIPIVLEIQ